MNSLRSCSALAVAFTGLLLMLVALIGTREFLAMLAALRDARALILMYSASPGSSPLNDSSESAASAGLALVCRGGVEFSET